MSFFQQSISSFSNMEKEKKALCSDVWMRISDTVQRDKLTKNGIHDSIERERIIEQLKIRPSLLVHIATQLSQEMGYDPTFAEVGTAQGLQSVMFAESFPNSLVYTCDVKDDRDPLFSETKNIQFIHGNSQKMSKVLIGKSKIDFCWIDGAHDHYSVINDFVALVSRTHSETVWAFDDYDRRFGCFHDINMLISHFREHVVLELGLTASGNPNVVVLARGFE